MKRFAFILWLLPISCLAQGFSDASAPFVLSTSSLRKGLVGYWRLEEASGTRYDCSKNGNHLTSNNSVSQAPGLQSQCASFYTTSSQWLSSTSTSLTLGASSFSISGWFFMTNNVTAMVLGRGTSLVNTNTEYRVEMYSGECYFTVSNHTNSVQVHQTIPVAGAWHSFICWYDGATVNISLDNAGASSVAYSSGTFDSGNSFGIGRCGDTAGGYFNGKIDEVGIWTRVLSAAERTQLYNSGLGTHFPWAHP